MSVEAEWEAEAENWVRWARTPGFDVYWSFRDAFFDSIVPSAGRRTLEVGCGEGRVARDLVAHGHSVVAIDTARTLIRYAMEEDRTSSYAVGEGAALPFTSRSFDLVVAYNSLQVVPNMADTVREAARVLVRGGSLCACIAHPVTDLGEFDAESRLTIRPDYFEHRRVEDRVEMDGNTMTFRGWTYSLEDYAVAFERAGLWIETMREPRPSAFAEKHTRWQSLPLFLNLRAVQVEAAANG
jgi:SAM-dependent methyltransferase